MLHKFAVLVAFASLATIGAAQGTILVKFPDAGPREVWVDNPSRKIEGTRVKTDRKEVELPYPSPQLGDRILVSDFKTGNISIKPVQKLTPGGRAAAGDRTPPMTWTWSPADETAATQVRIQITQNGKLVAAAGIRAKDSAREQSSLLAPSDNGAVMLDQIAFGTLKVKVDYKTTSGESKSTEQSFEVSRKRADPVPTYVIALSDPVATLGQASSSGPSPSGSSSTSAPAAEEKVSSSPLQILLVLVGLILGVGLLYLGVTLAKKHPKQLEEQLAKLGVKVPNPGDAQDAGPAPAAVPMKPAPVEPIVLPDAGAPLTQAAPVAAPVASGQPKLKLSTGTAFDLAEGSTIVGREAGSGLSLTDESSVSRQHAELVRTGTQVVLRDLGSTNGTFVNGVPLQGEVLLNSGDAVQFGAVQARFEG